MTTGSRLQNLHPSTGHLHLGELYERGYQLLFLGEHPVGASCIFQEHKKECRVVAPESIESTCKITRHAGWAETPHNLHKAAKVWSEEEKTWHLVYCHAL